MTFQLFSCHRLLASISRGQCSKNRARGMGSCVGCAGLPSEPIGEVLLNASAHEEKAAAEIPTVVLRFEDTDDQELFHTLQRICSDLEYDIISLLHLACRGDLNKMNTEACTKA